MGRLQSETTICNFARNWLLDLAPGLHGLTPSTDARPALIAAQVGALWVFQGVASNDRYTTKAEKTQLTSKQAPIGRPEATSSALLQRLKTVWPA